MKTPFPANVYDDGCKRLRWRMQTFTMADANVYDGGCKRLREKMQCTASEMGKTGTEIASPILDKRKGKKDSLHMGHSKPPGNFC